MRLMNKNDFLDLFYVASAGQDKRFVNAVEMVVEDTPTIDAVPVVRCSECKHRDPENHHCDHPAGATIYFPRKDDDFCSYGERKDGEG